MFHLVKRASDVARLQLDSAAAVYDHTRIEPELARVDRAVFHAVIQREPHQVNVFDSALLQIMGEAGVTAMRVIEKCAVAVDHWIGSLVENVSDATRVE